MASATIIHLGLGTRNHQRQHTTKIKLNVTTKFQLWTMTFDLYVIFIKYCSEFQVLNSAPPPLTIYSIAASFGLSAAAAGEEVAFFSSKINAWQSLEGAFPTLQVLWQKGLQFYSNDPFFSLFFWFCSYFLFACFISLQTIYTELRNLTW